MNNKKTHYVNGEWLQGDGEPIFSISPVTEETIWAGQSPSGGQVENAVVAASSAFSRWAHMEIAKRSRYLHRFVEIVQSRALDLAEAISLEVGKPLWEAKTEVSAMIGKLPPTLEAYKERNSERNRQHVSGSVIRTRFRPHGVVAVVGPFNFPGHMPNGHIMPALLAGNTVIFKPSEYAPLVAQLTVKCWEQAELPAGVLNLLQGGPEVGKALCQHGFVRAVFFTGSRSVGQSIHEAVGLAKMCALEMGGSSPLVVWDSSNIDAAVVAAIQSAFVTTGQRCSAARRLIVRRGAFGDKFLDRLVYVAGQLNVGKYTERPEPYMGPLRHPGLAERLLRKQDELINRGANPLLKARRLEVGTAFVSPGILDVSRLHEREDDEVLGPLLQVIRVDKFDDAIREANNTQYGLAAGLISEEGSLYERFMKDIQAGIVNWNQQLTGASPWAPFGGIKQSGNYRPSGYLAADYCVYSSGSIEVEKVCLPAELPSGLSL